MPKNIDILKDEPYRSILFLLTLFNEGLEPKEILISISDEKSIAELKQKVKYDISRIKDDLDSRKQKKNNYEIFSKYIKKPSDTKIKKNSFIESNRTNKIKTLKVMGAVYKEKKLIKITDKYQRICNEIIYQDTRNNYSSALSKHKDINRLKETEKKFKHSYKNLLKDFGSEKKEISNLIDVLENTVNKINNLISEKMKNRFQQDLHNFYNSTNSQKIKKAIAEKPNNIFCFFLEIPLYKIEFENNQELTYGLYRLFTGILLFDALDRRLFEEKKQQWVKDYEKYEKNPDKFSGKEKLLLLNQGEFIKKGVDYYEKNPISGIGTKQNCPIIIPKPIMEVFEKINFDLFERKISFNDSMIASFSKTWSNYFFHIDYKFSLQEINEIINWCFNELQVFKNMHKKYNELFPFDIMKYTNKLSLALNQETPFKPVIVK